MHRFLLRSVLVALAVLATATGPAAAHHHHHHNRLLGFVGFLDYRHSLDSDHHSHSLDRRREYVFHRMSAHEAYNELHGGRSYHHRHDHGSGHGRWESRAHAVTAIHRHGGGHHNHAWGIHASDHEHNH